MRFYCLKDAQQCQQYFSKRAGAHIGPAAGTTLSGLQGEHPRGGDTPGSGSRLLLSMSLPTSSQTPQTHSQSKKET